MSNKGERNYQTQKHWIKRLKKYGFKPEERYSGITTREPFPDTPIQCNYFALKDQGKPCSCYMCTDKYNRAQSKMPKRDIEELQEEG